MIIISNASDALKTIYLGVIAEQLNTKINPSLRRLKEQATTFLVRKSKNS